jgi:hypothetical protein
MCTVATAGVREKASNMVSRQWQSNCRTPQAILLFLEVCSLSDANPPAAGGLLVESRKSEV